MTRQCLTHHQAPAAGMLLDAGQQRPQIDAHTTHRVLLFHLLEVGNNCRVECKLFIDLDQCYLTLEKLLAYYILLEGPQIEILAESAKKLHILIEYHILCLLLYSLYYKRFGFLHNFLRQFVYIDYEINHILDIDYILEEGIVVFPLGTGIEEWTIQASAAHPACE